MKPKKNRSIEIPLREDGFDTAILFIEQWMSQRRINQNTIMTTVQLVKALFHHMAAQGYESGTVLTIKPQRSFCVIGLR